MQMYRPTERDEDSASEGDANCEDGDYLPGAGADSDTEDYMSEESEESEDVARFEEEQVSPFLLYVF